AKSPLSTSAVRKPRSAASRAIPAPVIPPPMTNTSTGSAAIDASARARVRCENGVSAANSPPLRADASFPPGAKGECNAGWKRTARRRGRRMSHAVLQGGHRAEGRARRRADIVAEASKATTAVERVKAFAKMRPRDLIPVSPAIAEPSTGETMGQSAEKMAKENRISREAQDRWALRSHQLAAQGSADGRLTAEIVPVFPSRPGDPIVTEDNGIRRDTSLEQMAKLKPVFDRRYGSVTAANFSPLTDGA